MCVLEVQVRVDRRTTLAQLKDRLSPIIGVPSTNFKVYRVYNNQQEYELERLNDTLMSTPTESKVRERERDLNCCLVCSETG